MIICLSNIYKIHIIHLGNKAEVKFLEQEGEKLMQKVFPEIDFELTMYIRRKDFIFPGFFL